MESLVRTKPKKTHILYSQENTHVQLGPIKLKPMMGTTFKIKWQEICNDIPTRREYESRDEGNVLPERD